MKNTLVFFVAVVLTAAVSAVVTQRMMSSHSACVYDAHAWLHKELELTAEQHKALDPLETQFAAREEVLSRQFDDANRDLAKILSEEKAYTPRVAAAVERVHQRMGDLQKASIEHLYAMRAVLTPEQDAKLMKVAQCALEQGQ